MRHRTKFCADRSRRCGYMAVFDFSKWRPSVVWTTHEVYFGGLCHCVKFGLNRCSSFDNTHYYSRLFFGAFGAKMGENRNFLYFYPSRNATHPETRILRYNLSKSVQRFDP